MSAPLDLHSESVNSENKKVDDSNVLSEVNSELPTEVNAPLKEVQKDENKLSKFEMCQLIYYDFSLK